MPGNLPLSAERLWSDLMAMARVGATPGGGCNRQALTDIDAEGRALLARWGEAAGLSLTVDRVGTMRLARPGRDPARAPVAIGSHLDTQPSGGRFDGVLGVLAGLEVLRALHEAGSETEAPLLLLNWTNEEGARFPPPMMASGTAMGVFTLAETLARTDSEGAAFGAELARIGWAGEAEPAELRGLGAYFELHIEQGTAVARERGVEVTVAPFWVSPLTPFDAVLAGRLRAAAGARGLLWRDMPTGIGHDAVYVARCVPAAMLFVPCVGGVSHNEAELITPEWAAAGLHVLADAVLETAGLVT